MTKNDLLSALGNIDEKFICKAFEKAAAENVSAFDDEETEGRVGAMDKKKYIKNKIVPIVTVAAAVILCVGSLIYITQRNNDDKITPPDNNAVTSQSQSEQSDSSTENSESTPDCVYEVFGWGDNEEFAEHIYKIVSDKGFVNTTYKLHDGTTEEIIYLYEFECIEGYSLFTRYETASNYVYSFYRKNGDRTGSATNKITMTWEIGTESQSALQGKIDYYNSQGYAVNEISNMPGYYYVDFHGYQKVLWCEEDYYFELQFPVSVGSINTNTHIYTGEYLFSLKKTQYIIDENGNATELEVRFSESPYELFQKHLIELQTQNPDEIIEELDFNQKLAALSSGFAIGVVCGSGCRSEENPVAKIKEFIDTTDLTGEELDKAIISMAAQEYCFKVDRGSGVHWTDFILDKDGKHIVTYHMVNNYYLYYDENTKTYLAAPLSEIGLHGEFDNSDDDIGGVFYEDNHSNSVADGNQKDVFFANNSKDIIQNDYEQIHSLCTKVCSVLAKISHGNQTESLAEYLVNSDLETYLNYEFSNLPIRLNESDSMTFNITSYEINNGFAFVTGNYQNNTSSEGPFVFIIENSEGKLIVNDLICMFMDSADYAYRSEIVNIPKADFWKDPVNYSEILNMINEQK